jgi:hypothetical protein
MIGRWWKRSAHTRSSTEKSSPGKLILVSLAVFAVAVLGGCAGLVSAGGSGNTVTFQLSPANISFGKVTVGKQSTQSITVSNTGNASVKLTSAQLSNQQFSVNGMTLPLSLAAGKSARFNVAVTPSAAGNISGTLTVAGDSGITPVVVGLSASGVSATAQLSVNPASMDFGSVAIGAKGTSTLTVSNNGAADLTISVLTLAGADFSIGGITTPKTIAAGQSASATITFSPAAAGNASGSLTITSNDPANPSLTVGLTGSGNGAPAGLSVLPATFSFGNVVDGQTKSQSFTAKNAGGAALTIAQLSVNGAAYSVSGLNTPATLAAGASTTFSVLFAPTTAGTLAGSVSIASNAPNSPNAVALTGTGVAASVTLSASPSNVSFSAVNAGSASTRSVTLTNSGNTSMTLSQVSVNAKDFSVSGITTPVSLGAGQNAVMMVNFQPSASENISGNIIVSSSTGATAVIPVSGTGLQPALTVTPATANFGSVSVGSPSSQTVQLTNSGTGTLTVSQLSVSGSGFSTGTLALPISLGANQSRSFNVLFSPASAGTVSGSVSIVSNAPKSPATIALSGTGIAASLTLSFSSTGLTFGNVNTATSTTQTITATNTGNSSVTISRITENGAGFSLSGAGTPVTLSAGQRLTFSVMFSPTAPGNDSGTVTVTSNASGSPATISLSGTGVTVSTHTVLLNWTASTSTVTGYNVYRSTTSGSGYSKVNSVPVSGLTYTDSSTLLSGTTYYYVTTAVDSNGDESTYSNQASAAIP